MPKRITEAQKQAVLRMLAQGIDRETIAAPAKVRFHSIELLLEDLGPINLEGIHWAIVGGESRRGARPMKEEWVLAIRDQCQKAGVVFSSSNGAGFTKAKQDGI